MAKHLKRKKQEGGTYVDGAHAHPDLEAPIMRMAKKVERLEKKVSKLDQKRRRRAFAGR